MHINTHTHKWARFTKLGRVSLTFPDFEVLEGELGSGVVQQHLSVEREHHGAFVHVHHAAHHVSRQPGAAEVLVPLMPALSLQTHSSASIRPQHQ